ncbi:MAG: hypothetical protein WBA63_07360 [Thermomicrobiales bacterium]
MPDPPRMPVHFEERGVIVSTSPNQSMPDPRDGLAETPAAVRKRSQAVAWGSALFLALGVGIPLGYAMHDWVLGAIVGVVLGVVSAVGYLVAGSTHAERRAQEFRDQYSRDEQDDEDDDGSYN